MAVLKSFQSLPSKICKVVALPGRHIECSVYFVSDFRSGELVIDPEWLWSYRDNARGADQYKVDISWTRDKSWQTPFLFDKISDIIYPNPKTGDTKESLFMLGTLDSSNTDINLIIMKDCFDALFVIHLAVTNGIVEWSDDLKEAVFKEVIKACL